MSDQEDTLLESMKQEIAAETPQTGAEEQKTTEEPKNEEVQEDNEAGEEGASEDKNEEVTAKTDDEGAEHDEPEKPRGRPSASETIRALKAERKEREAELERLRQDRARLDAEREFERRRQFEAQSEAQRRAEEEKLSLLDPTERALYQANKRSNELEYRFNILQMQLQETADKSAFDAKMSTDPLYAKYAPQVEKLYQEGRQRGVTAPREELLNLVLGRELRKDAASKLSGKKESAQKRIDTAKSKAPGAKSDVAGSRKGQTEEDRLRGVLI